MRYLRLASKADAERAALPAPVRRLVTDRLVHIANNPDPAHIDDLVLVAPASVNSGLILTVVVHGLWFVMIPYRIRSDRNEVWVPTIIAVKTDPEDR